MIEKPKYFQRRRVCRFCTDKQAPIDYKDVLLLKSYQSERGKIMPRRISGNCAKHQRLITAAIRKARNLALLSFAEER
ncbi:MAG: 30S ribosomal protein S18 [Nitrospirota bacterium]|jgi:small subunit ribosomal protein S18|nr:30S ribosomal protein S18 [Nitrospirota bacterium]